MARQPRRTSLPLAYPIGWMKSEVMNKCVSSYPLGNRCQDRFRNARDLLEVDLTMKNKEENEKWQGKSSDPM